jgi:hypothetical protein
VLSKLRVKVVGHKLRIRFTISEAALVTIRFGQRKWVVHAPRGHDTVRRRWRRLSRGRHRLFIVATDLVGVHSKRYTVHFRYRPRPKPRPKVFSSLQLF